MLSNLNPESVVCSELGLRHYTPVSSLELSCATGMRSAVTLTGQRQLSTHSTGSLTYSYAPSQGLGLDVSVQRQLSNHSKGRTPQPRPSDWSTLYNWMCIARWYNTMTLCTCPVQVHYSIVVNPCRPITRYGIVVKPLSTNHKSRLRREPYREGTSRGRWVPSAAWRQG